MKKILILFTFILIFSCANQGDFKPKETNLVSHWDTIRPLANPDKGWYHHTLDNGIGKYLIQDDSVLNSFPGMDHLYLRLAWAFLEPEEGKFDWSYIDDYVDKYVPMGYKISFRISCKETGPAPTSVPVEIDGIRYATPYWVVQAGAEGIKRPEYGSASWTPDWDNPIFMEKLNNFYKAFAAKYDDKPWVRYVDVGSIGEWGEGHTFFSTKIPATVEEIKTHMNIYLKHFKNTQLIITDDLIAYGKTEEEMNELLDYAIENDFSLRDDSPLVLGYMENDLDTWTVRHPELFKESYKTMPNVFELQHYGHVLDDGNWLGKNGKKIIPEYGVSGAEVFRNAMKIIRPTYIGYHGFMGDWLSDNPDLTIELLNHCGYWYFPISVNASAYKNDELTFEIKWLNKGLAPAYNEYSLRGKLISKANSKNIIDFEIENSGNKNWMPDSAVTEKYQIAILEKLEGEYDFAIQLFDKQSDKSVEMGIKEDLIMDDFFMIQELTF